MNCSLHHASSFLAHANCASIRMPTFVTVSYSTIQFTTIVIFYVAFSWISRAIFDSPSRWTAMSGLPTVLGLSVDPFLWLSGSMHSDRSQHEPGCPSPNSVIRNRPYSQVCCLQGKHSQIFSAGQQPSSVHRPIRSLFQVHHWLEQMCYETSKQIDLNLTLNQTDKLFSVSLSFYIEHGCNQNHLHEDGFHILRCFYI